MFTATSTALSGHKYGNHLEELRTKQGARGAATIIRKQFSIKIKVSTGNILGTSKAQTSSDYYSCSMQFFPKYVDMSAIIFQQLLKDTTNILHVFPKSNVHVVDIVVWSTLLAAAVMHNGSNPMTTNEPRGGRALLSTGDVFLHPVVL